MPADAAPATGPAGSPAGAGLIDGVALAKLIRAEVATEVVALKAQGVTPGLTVVLVGDDAGSAVYVGAKEKASREAGMAGETVRLPADTSQAQLLALVEQLNADDTVEVILEGHANVRLMDDANYTLYREGKTHHCLGGHVKTSPVHLSAPRAGHWR